MKLHVELSPEELQELDRVLQREIAATRTELRRTGDWRFQKHVEHELELLESIEQTVALAEESIDLTIG